MIGQLEFLIIKLCEIFPFDVAFFEKNGFCQKPSEHCIYCKKKSKTKYFCTKKTYSPSLPLGYV